MSKGLDLYKSIVDGLANLGKGVHRKWVMEKGWPQTSDNEDINEFVRTLDASGKEVLVRLLEDARESGIHDTLVYLNDRMAIDGLRFTEDGIEMEHQPFDTELYYDWMCRIESETWPDDE